MNHTENSLEFHRIKEMLCTHAVSGAAKEALTVLCPTLSLRECRARTEETTEARTILDSAGAPPIAHMEGLGELLDLCEKGAMLTAEQLEGLSSFLSTCRRLRAFLGREELSRMSVAGYGASLSPLEELKEELDAAVRSGQVLSTASPTLRDIRRKIENQEGQIRRKLDELLRGRKNCFTDSMVSVRNGRFVLPVKKEYKHQISGAVVDISGSGGTYFIEPSAVSRLQEETNTLKIEEDNEVRRVLYTLTALVDECLPRLRLNVEAMTALDVAFAKAHLSREVGGVPAEMGLERRISLVKARHPLLDRSVCVPLEVSLGGAVRGVVITGPNTGGKTVALKTVGLLSLMAQSGLHVPAERAELCMLDGVLCDIGDGQSISENLSTFSSHITNVIRILDATGPESLVLLDELGSGTDPAEGMGIAVSILEELRRRGCLFLATTHYPEVKEYASQAGGLVNARMAFDRESLRPLYRLEQGEAGESCALYIAQRLGLPPQMLERAREAAEGRLPAGGEDVPVPAAPSRLKQDAPVRARTLPGSSFALGDSVEVGPDGTLGLVFRPADAKGMVGVQIKGEKSMINYKRLTLKTPAAELYPSDYDFSILFDSVELRKARHQMERKFVAGLTVELDGENL